MSKPDNFQVLVNRTKASYPRFNIKERDKSWLRPIFWLLGKITRRNYDTFTTTIFSTMYVGPTYERKTSIQRYRLLRHEKEHVRQFHCWPLGRWAWPVNHMLVALCYLLVLPIILTLRAKFEREGYLQTLLVSFELDGTIPVARMARNAKWIADTFGGPAYFWMWRKKAAYAWAIEVQRKINAMEITNEADDVRRAA